MKEKCLPKSRGGDGRHRDFDFSDSMRYVSDFQHLYAFLRSSS